MLRDGLLFYLIFEILFSDMHLFKGRIGRGLFFWLYLSIYTIVAFAQYIRGAYITNDGSLIYFLITILHILILLGLLIAYLSLYIRRLHDIGKTGWWVLLVLAPLINIAFVIYLFFARSEGKNKYGKVPKSYIF